MRWPRGEFVDIMAWQVKKPVRRLYIPPASTAELHAALDCGDIEWYWPEWKGWDD